MGHGTWEEDAKRREAEGPERRRRELLESATLGNFLKSLAPAVLCPVGLVFVWSSLAYWGPLSKLSYVQWLVAVVFGGLHIGLLIGTVAFIVIFLYRWLAIVTLKTPENFRPVVHFLGALVLASLVTFLSDGPLSAIRETYVYLEHHGFFALKLSVVAVLVATVAYNLAKEESLDEIFAYPLRCYALLTVGSFFLGGWMTPEETGKGLVHYVGTLMAVFLGFALGSTFGRGARKDKITDAVQQCGGSSETSKETFGTTRVTVRPDDGPSTSQYGGGENVTTPGPDADPRRCPYCGYDNPQAVKRGFPEKFVRCMHCRRSYIN